MQSLGFRRLRLRSRRAARLSSLNLAYFKCIHRT
nr:MAG TPA: hypothetical protein [Caudoviricetes sp.]